MKTTSSLSSKLRGTLESGTFFARLLRTPDQRVYAWRWLRSRQNGYLLNHAYPWIAFSAIDFLDAHLNQQPNPRVFEYGSGGSTLYWLRNGAECVSVEHDPAWYQLVRERIASPVDLRLIEADAAVSHELNPSNPADYASMDANYLNRPFKRYVEQIDAFADGTFDLILIDGRARVSCLAHSLKKVRVGGYIILDNSDREYYTQHIDLSDFHEHRFEGAIPVTPFFSRTSIYQRER